jgi:hypothetical protein
MSRPQLGSILLLARCASKGPVVGTRAGAAGWYPIDAVAVWATDPFSALAGTGAAAVAAAMTVVIVAVAPIVVVPVVVVSITVVAIVVVSVVPDLLRRAAARCERRGRPASLHRLQHGAPFPVAAIHGETLP